MRITAVPSVLLTMSALVLAVPPAMAQDAVETADAVAAPPSDLADLPNPGPALTPEETAALGNALSFDPASLAGAHPAKPLRLPSLSTPHNLAVTRTDRPDGSSTVVVKQPLPAWDANVGADLGMAPAPTVTYQPDKPIADRNDRTSGAAWASLGVTKFATVDARVDPGNDQGRLGTTLKHSIPVGDKFKVTLQDSYSMTESYGAPTATAPAGLPVMTLPQATGSTAPSQVFGNQQAVKFDIMPTGTSLAAALNSSSTDPVTHNTLSAEQKLLGPLHVTTAVTDVGQPTVNKSIGAGFKLHW